MIKKYVNFRYGYTFVFRSGDLEKRLSELSLTTKMHTRKDESLSMGMGRHVPGGATPLASLDGANRCSTPSTDDETRVVPSHPLGIKPAGNAFSAVENAKIMAGLFFSLSDELILQVLEFLDHSSLLRLGASCKLFYAFCQFDDLWKNLFIEYVFPFFLFSLLSASLCSWREPRESLRCLRTSYDV